MKPSAERRAFRIPEIVSVAAAVSLYATGCAAVRPPKPPPVPPAATPEALRERWGIEVVAMRQSAGGHMLDFRYRVLDPIKATPLMDRRVTPYLLDPATGARLRIPSPPKVGALRQTPREAVSGNVYFMIFANPGRMVRKGAAVDVVIGDCRAAEIVVE